MQATVDNKTMNAVLTDLLANLGVESVSEMELGEAYEVDMSDTVFMDLHVEKVRPNRLSIAHYYEQNGDLCPDPDVVFKPVEDRFVPVEIFRKSVLGATCELDPDGVTGNSDFLETWAKNLRTQGHVEAAKTASSLGGA